MTFVHALDVPLLALVHTLGEPLLNLVDPQIESGESGIRIGPQLAQVLLDAGEPAVYLLKHVSGGEILGHDPSFFASIAVDSGIGNLQESCRP